MFEVVGKKFGLSKEGSVGILVIIVNILVMFKFIWSMFLKDKVINILFVVCLVFLLGDYLFFIVNF